MQRLITRSKLIFSKTIFCIHWPIASYEAHNTELWIVINQPYADIAFLFHSKIFNVYKNVVCIMLKKIFPSFYKFC